ncbi:MAG: extracellular solute-binding protein [Actinobacteria bacterium]|jgi:raffinose/stachyose/melibiose transport system substrate-binding protein|nr:extracellular solute-binding protein [Actinomycetota bacterium]NCV42308.1 extracellular solute-binding protein [Actinomycetota bacterium]NCV82369.1 extracellular solute-binding protein [Actinomycetota bacterium]NCW72620.1 extracellular solute-binding protein [Actinomycetota bacterium]NCW92191.1 extracellular solute-binding protein [Actinomycetota bacterium]
MKTKGLSTFASLRAGVVALVATALVITPLAVAHAADAPTFGKACTTEGVSTGQATTSLICQTGSNGKLTWQRVRLGSTNARPVAASSAPDGTIEFHHWRPEDKVVLQGIIDKFESANPGTKINQVIMSSVDYTNLAYAKISANKKAAVFVTSRGGQFNQFYNGGLLADLSNQRFMKQNVIASALTPGTVNGKLYGLPYQSLFNNPLYNADLFAKQGWKVPTTWTQTLAFCKTAKAAGFIPFAWPGATRGNAGQIINSFLMNSAPDLATLTERIAAIDTGKADLLSPWFVEIANKYKAMADAGCFPPNPTGYNDTVAPADFASGKAAIYPTGTFGMSTVTKLNPAMSGKMKMMSFITTDAKPLYQGITNNTFILSVNAKASSTDQRIAAAFISFLAQSENAQAYAVGTSQHVSIINVDYSANVDLLNTSDIMGKKLLLAPRFLFNNVNNVRNPLEDALIAIAGGADVTKTLTDTSKTIKQGLSS